MKPQLSPRAETNKIVEFEAEYESNDDQDLFLVVVDERDRFFEWSVEPELLGNPNNFENGS